MIREAVRLYQPVVNPPVSSTVGAWIPEADPERGPAAVMTSFAVPVAYPSPTNINLQNNLTATTNPAITDDDGDGWVFGSKWLNTVTGDGYVCLDPAAGAAVWAPTFWAGLTVDESTLTHQDNLTPTQIAAWGSENSGGGQMRISVDGAVVEGIIFETVRIRAQNVTFRNCIFLGAILADESSYPTDNLLIEYCKGRFEAGTDSGVKPLRGYATIRHSDIRGAGDTVKGYVGVRIEFSVIWGNEQPPSSHPDTFQCQSGTNYFFVDSTFISSMFSNASVYFDGDGDAIGPFSVLRCYMAGGAQITCRLSGNITGGLVQDCVFEDTSPTHIQNAPDSGGTSATLLGNQTWDPVNEVLSPL